MHLKCLCKMKWHSAEDKCVGMKNIYQCLPQVGEESGYIGDTQGSVCVVYHCFWVEKEELQPTKTKIYTYYMAL